MEIHMVSTIMFWVAVMGTVVVSFLLIHMMYKTVWVKCVKVRRKIRKQGIRGPPVPFLFYGNVAEMKMIQLQVMEKMNNTTTATDPEEEYDALVGIVAHDYTSSLFPYLEQWRKQYGPLYTYSTGMRQHLYVNEPELVKELNSSLTLNLGKPSYVTKRLAPMLGNGILRSNGLVWAQQRKIVAPEFFMDKVKDMVGIMLESAHTLVRKWGEMIEEQGGVIADIKVDEDLREVSADVISRACFGSSNYVKGKEIFSKLRSLQKLISQRSFLFGVSNFAILKKKKGEISKLENEIETLIWDAVQERAEQAAGSSDQKDLMQLIMEGMIKLEDERISSRSSSSKESTSSSAAKPKAKQMIVDNCKSIYFAGHESTAVAASWCLMLLSVHPEWQSRIRTEVAQHCQHGLPNASSISHLKSLHMVVLEVLRLYPPAAFVSREALEDTQIGNKLTIPKGVCLWTLIPTLHRDPAIWGEDANEFKPQRFVDGISKACKFSQAYIPFGVGPRLCLGRNFAMLQLKLVLSLIISNFSFSLSPKYQHSPSYKMIVEPGHGVNILLRRSHQDQCSLI